MRALVAFLAVGLMQAADVHAAMVCTQIGDDPYNLAREFVVTNSQGIMAVNDKGSRENWAGWRCASLMGDELALLCQNTEGDAAVQLHLFGNQEVKKARQTAFYERGFGLQRHSASYMEFDMRCEGSAFE